MNRSLLFLFCCASRVVAATVACQQLQVDVPDSWERFDVPFPVLYGSRGPAGELLQVSFADFSPAITDLSDGRFKDFKKGFVKKASRIVSEQATTVANKPALQIEFEVGIADGTIVPLSSWFILNEDGIYSITLSGVPDLDTRRDLIESIRFDPAASPAGKRPAVVPPAEKLGEYMFYVLVAGGVLVFILKSREKK